jgi:hypothetical protein
MSRMNKKYAYTTVMVGEGWGLAKVYQDIPGYEDVELSWFCTLPVARAEADKLNAELGFTQIEAWDVVRSADLGPCMHQKAYRRNPHDEFTYWCPTCGFQWNTEAVDENNR